MNVFLITFCSLNDEIQQKIIESIKTYSNWGRITMTTYVVKSDYLTVQKIRDDLNKYIEDTPGRLFVCDISMSAWASYNLPIEVTMYLKER